MAIKPDSHCYIYNYPVKNKDAGRSPSNLDARPDFALSCKDPSTSIIDYWYAASYFNEVKLFECDVCPYRSRFQHTLDKHKRLHLPDNTSNDDDDQAKNICSLCDFKCLQKSVLAYHFKLLHAPVVAKRPEQLICVHCAFTTKHKGTLNTHMRIHTGDKPFHCNKCPFKSATKSDLKNHMRVHTGEKPYHCQICDYKSNRKSNLNNHLRNHLIKPFNCSVCFYQGSSKDELLEHTKTHTQLKLYTCKECNSYETNSRSHFEKHLHIHTGENKPFHCSLCDYKCSKEHSLKVHNETHNVSLTHKCTLCNYEVSKKSSYNLHMKKHAEQNESRLGGNGATVKTRVVDNVAKVAVVTFDKQIVGENNIIDGDLLELIKQEDIALKDK